MAPRTPDSMMAADHRDGGEVGGVRRRQKGAMSGPDEDSATMAKQVFTRAEVAAHNTPGDCWLVIHDGVYDVTDFVSRHPGGPLIFCKAGGENTALFEAYHPLYVRKLLDKFKIGQLAADPRGGGSGGVSSAPQEAATSRVVPKEEDARYPRYAFDSDKGEFYHTVKSRVEAVMKEKGVDPRVSAAMYVKSACILLGLAACYLAAFYGGLSFGWSLLLAVGFGFFQGEIGVSIQHDANHGCYSRSPTLSMVMGWTLDLAGASSFMWKQQHVVGHHAYTNVVGVDPDIRVNDNDVRRVAMQHPHRPQHRYQHVYLLALYGLLALKSVVLDDFMALAEGCIGHVRIAKMTTLDTAVFWGGKAVFFSYALVAPLLWSHHSAAAVLVLLLAAELTCGWLLAFMFQVAHVQSEVDWFVIGRDNSVRSGPSMLGSVADAPLKDGEGRKVGWGAGQVLSSADFCHGSFFWTHVSGGLNYQIVHHLFPGVCHCHYPLIAPVIRQTCLEFGHRYTHYTTFASALSSHIEHLRRLAADGSAFLGVPSMHTVG